MGMSSRESEIDYSKKYLTFEALEDSSFMFSKAGLSYSIDNGNTWTALDADTATPTVSAGNEIIFKGKMTSGTTYGNQGIGIFSATGTFNASGNIMSLLHSDNFIGQTDLTGRDYVFFGLFQQNDKLINASNLILPATALATYCYGYVFYNCTSLITAPKLPATILSTYCYMGMFYGCTSLTTAPALPSITLADNCYSMMFYDCTSLTIAPELPAITLTSSCYQSMFSGCTSLTTAPTLPATTMTSSCYSSMFKGCTSLTAAPELPATTVNSSCYKEMFNGCTSLITAPELPAIELKNLYYCYEGMFNGCSSLNYIKAMFTTKPSTNYTNNWVDGVSATGTFVKNSAATWDVTGVNGIPEGWTVQTADN